MNSLPIILTKNGFTYSLMLRGKKACIYKQHISPHVISYEVFIIQVLPAQEINGRGYLKREVFPSNEAFGYKAWAISDINQAMIKYNELENQQYK